MLKGLSTEDGQRDIPWDLLDLTNDVDALGPADAAIIAAIQASARARADLDPMAVSASEAEKGIRQMYLERTEDYYLPPSALVGGLMGTVRHAATFDENHPEFITERRFSDEWGSAQIDTFHIPSGVLSDLKTLGWYKVKLLLTKGIMDEGLSYVLQVNRQRQLLEAQTPYKVTQQHLMIVPIGVQGRVRAEAASLGVAHGMLRMKVPRISDDAIVTYYQRKAENLRAALEAKAAPFCEAKETWGGKKCADRAYCPVNKICWRLSQAAGQPHPYLNNEPE